MNSEMKHKRLRISGMTCISCQQKIDRSLRKMPGVHRVKVSFSTGTAEITYDPSVVSLPSIIAAIEQLDYKVTNSQILQSPNLTRFAGLLLIIAALYFLLQRFGVLNLLVPSQLASIDMSMGMLFVIGLVTSVHCVAMCGGINLSQCLPRQPEAAGDGTVSTWRASLLYNTGRVISYTVVGFIVGALGSALTFSDTLQGVLKIIAGVFMVIMGINMLGLFPWLRRLNPRLPRFLTRLTDQGRGGSSSPLIVGLLNGLMPCGPLQAMQIYALSTGNPLTGALSMFVFSLGTVPLMFGLGALTAALGKKFSRKIMTAGAVLVVVLGMAMFSQGWTLSGMAITPGTPTGGTQTAESTNIVNGVQQVNSMLASSRYPNITVQAGIPVKWVINAPQGSINGCNNRMIIQEYDISHEFKTGDNIIEFTPDRTGKFQYSCWMGMIRATITVIEGSAASESAGTSRPDSGSSSQAVDLEGDEPVAAGYRIPADKLSIAKASTDEYGDDIQLVSISLTDAGFAPAIIVVEANTNVQWEIINQSTAGDVQLRVPVYAAELPLQAGENTLVFFPSESFDFSTGDSSFFGYIKVVDDLEAIDPEQIKAEVSAFEPLIYPSSYFSDTSGSGASCH